MTTNSARLSGDSGRARLFIGKKKELGPKGGEVQWRGECVLGHSQWPAPPLISACGPVGLAPPLPLHHQAQFGENPRIYTKRDEAAQHAPKTFQAIEKEHLRAQAD